jgi:hypothetical protein
MSPESEQELAGVNPGKCGYYTEGNGESRVDSEHAANGWEAESRGMCPSGEAAARGPPKHPECPCGTLRML